MLDCHGTNISLVTLNLDLQVGDQGRTLTLPVLQMTVGVALASMALLIHKPGEAVSHIPQPASWLSWRIS